MKFIVDLLINGPERLSAWFAWLPPLFARIVVGWVFLWSGWGKLNALDRITQNFVEWGIPFPHIMTPFVSGVEFFGGLLLAARAFHPRRRGATRRHDDRGDPQRQVG